jgi:prepilin peptidase CpaA
MLEPSVLIPVVLLVVGAAVNFWRGTVPNWLVLPMLAAFPLFGLWAGMPFADMGWHVLAFVITFAVVIGLFALGLMGGGAGKLVAATALWLPPSMVLWFLLLAVGLGVAFLVAGQYMTAKRAKVVANRFAGVVATIGALFLAMPGA